MMFAILPNTMPVAPAAVAVAQLTSPDARQGAVGWRNSVFAISDHAISRLDARNGRVLARWQGDPAVFKHLNSCIVRRAMLVCASSNYPELPMLSRVETFDAATLRHDATRDLGAGPGSLTWLDWHRGSWWACYANYDGRGGQPGRDHRTTLLVRFDSRFKQLQNWHFPMAVLDRLAPRSASGGTWGSDGRLYVTGHDRPEIYVLKTRSGASTMSLVGLFGAPIEGQAIGWANKRRRLLWTIDRRHQSVVKVRLPHSAARG